MKLLQQLAADHVGAIGVLGDVDGDVGQRGLELVDAVVMGELSMGVAVDHHRRAGRAQRWRGGNGGDGREQRETESEAAHRVA